MLIIADENIPYVREAFGSLGEVRVLAGRSIRAEDIRHADVLLVRSVTRVGEALLSGSSVRFVGTATAGTDHVDTEWLAAKGITFADAAGSNAESVAQYIAAALLHLRELIGGTLEGKSIGIVGVGHVGTRVERVARALKMNPVLCDPPMARATNEKKYRPLGELAACDVVTLHTPLSHSGADATVGMIGEKFIRAMKPGAILINAARGGIVDESVLKLALDEKRLAGAVLDCWVNEPNIDVELLERVNIGTPHIAGYSLDGKIRGTEMVYDALCKFLNVQPLWSAALVLPETIRTVRPEASIPSKVAGGVALEPSGGARFEIDTSDPESLANAPPIVKLVNLLLIKATKDHADSIRIEPLQESARVGLCFGSTIQEIPSPPKFMVAGLVARIKDIAQLKLAEGDVSQQGSGSVWIDNRLIRLDVRTFPVLHGEALVIRLFNKGPAINTGEDAFEFLVEDAYPVVRDHLALRQIRTLPADQRGAYFDSLRRDYPVRREFAATTVITQSLNTDLALAAQQLGFRVAERDS